MAIILCVEDEPDSVEPVQRFLRQAGHVVECHPNGREALTALMRRVPDVILLDLRMPEMDGVTFLQVLRSYLRWHDVPVIILTAVPDSVELERAMKHGIYRVFRKADYRLSDLVETIDELTRGKPARV